jgi:hypothetical protein
MVVTALIYSGISNPSWTVPEARAAEVSRAIAGIPRLDRDCPPQGGLGYSGVRVEIPDRAGTERTWIFAKGFAVSGDDCYRDAGRKIERFLLETGRGRVDPTLLEAMLR